MDADLMLALKLAEQDTEESTTSPKPPPQAAAARAPSPKHPPTSGAARAPSSKPAAKKSQPVGLGDHFALKSSFANDASTNVTDDESSLADVLLALKLSAEEQAANIRGSGNDERGPHSKLSGQRSTSIRELLQLEANDRRKKDGDDDDEEESSSVMDLVAAGITAKSNDKKSNTATTDNDAMKQQRMYERIMEEEEEEERRQFELALKASEESTGIGTNTAAAAAAPSSHDDHVDDDLKMALAFLSRDDPNYRSGGELKGSSDDDFMLQQQRAMEQFAAAAKTKDPPFPPLDHERGRNSLVQRGTAETHRAIKTGKAHVVTCRGCQSSLQAPTAYSLVFCPSCQTVSPTGM
jgi:hypothetical protein